MRNDGCYGTGALNTLGSSQVGKPQRYTQYALQFTDYNKFGAAICTSPRQSESTNPGDQNCDGNIVGDDDDEDLGIGPRALSGSVFNELYLLRNIQGAPERRIFRVVIERDPSAPPITSPNGVCDTQS